MPKTTRPEETPQQRAFRLRVDANIHVPDFVPNLMQRYITGPQLIPHALKLGFRTILAMDEERARNVLEKYVRSIPMSVTGSDVLNARRLAIWIFRQSKGLTEEVVLHSPFDPDDRMLDEMVVARVGIEFCHMLVSSCMPIVDLYTILNGIGCPLYLSVGSGEGVYHFYLTNEAYNARKARRLKWSDAMAGIKEIEVPEVGR